jgi:hypothetical protein
MPINASSASKSISPCSAIRPHARGVIGLSSLWRPLIRFPSLSRALARYQRIRPYFGDHGNIAVPVDRRNLFSQLI